MSAKESQIEKKIRLYVISTGGLFHKLNANYDPNIPDRLAVYPNSIPVYIELKKQDGIVSDGQDGKINSLERKGFRVHVVRSLKSFKEILSTYDDIQNFIQTYNVKRQTPKTRTKARYTVYKR